MDEYIKRESAMKIVTDIMCDCKVTHKGRAIRRNIKQIPTADVVEVVRCMHCQHFKTNINKENYCDIHSTTWDKFYVRDDDYCSYGRRIRGD